MKKTFGLIRRVGVGFLLLSLATEVWAGNVAIRAGFTPDGYSTGKFTYDSGSNGTIAYAADGSTPLPVGYAVHCFSVGVDGNINDPGYGDDLLIGSVKSVGDDTDSWNTFAATAGKLYHDFAASDAALTSGANLYFRTWNNATPQAAGAFFGESNLVSGAYDASIMPLPTNCGLNNTSTVLAQLTPEAATLGTVTPHAAAPGGSPSITINANSAVHGRWYEIEVSSPEAGSGGPFTFNSYRTGTVTNTRHAADVNTGSTRGTTLTLAQTDDNKWVKVRVRPMNDYGPGAYTEGGPYFIPQTADPNIPIAITDLQVTTEGTNVVLSWSAPYDQDRYGSATTCTAYEVRVSREAIVDTPVSPFTPGQTNPGNISNWTVSHSIEAYFSPAPAVPAPAAYGTPQNITISGAASSGPLLFGIKSRDTSNNWSYISNIAGIGGAGGGGWAADLSIAFDGSGNPVLTWSGNAGSYDIWSAGADEVYTLLAGSLAGTTYTDAAAPAVRYYQVRPAGSQGGTQVAGKYTFNFVKGSGKTGINTFAIPFSSGIKGRTVSSIAAADDLINDIGLDKVEFVGRWNEADQKAEGRVVYTTNPANWYGPNFTLEKGKSYQLSVSESVSWTIVGKK